MAGQLHQFAAQLVLAGQIELIFAGVDVGVLGQRDFDQRVVLLLAEQDADGGSSRRASSRGGRSSSRTSASGRDPDGELAELEVDAGRSSGAGGCRRRGRRSSGRRRR